MTNPDEPSVTLRRSEWDSLLTVLDTIHGLDCDDETAETIVTLRNRIRHQL